MDDKTSLEDFLSPEDLPPIETDAEEEEVEAEAETETEAEKPEEPEKAEEPEKEPKEESPSDSEPWHIKAVLDERDKRQKLERQLEELQSKLPKEGDEPTSFFDDEGKARQEVVDQIRNEFLQRELKQSERRAIGEHGEETVETATKWFNEKALKYPSLLERFHESYNDVGEIVKMYQDDQKIANIGTFEEQIRADERAKVEAKFKAQPEPEPSPTPSLASTASSETEEVVDDTLDAVTLGV